MELKRMGMQMLDMEELFSIEIERDELSDGDLDKLAEVVEDYEATDMSVMMENGKSTLQIGAYKSHHLRELSDRLSERGLIDVAEMITEKKDKRLSENRMYV